MKKSFLAILLLFGVYQLNAQQISKDYLLHLTREWKGERFADGRPKVSDAILNRMKKVTHEEAWAVLRNKNYRHQYVGNWQTINPDSILVGRAVTAIFMPGRPDIQIAIDEKGTKQDGRLKAQNTWVIETLVKRDVYVVDQFNAYEDDQPSAIISEMLFLIAQETVSFTKVQSEI